MHKFKKRIAAVLILVPLFVVSGCSGKVMEKDSKITELFDADPETELANESVDAGAAAQETVSTETKTAGYIYVCGAVERPGVYPITDGMRLFEGIELAGGFTEDADQEWLNQAEKVYDGEKICIYTREETAQMSTAGQSPEQTPDTDSGKININTADRGTLMSLPGIGEAKADAVIRYREEHGGFQSVEEIQNISGIKTAVFSKIRELITV